MTLPFIDVVVPTFNRVGFLHRVMQSLLEQNYPSERYQIVVVDDGSPGETWPFLQKISASQSRVRALRVEHGGPYAARNEGWRAGSGEIVAFTDDDCIADPGWLAAIAKGFANHPEALGLQGKTITLPQQVTPLTHQIVVLRPNTRYETCNMAYRRNALWSVGGFEPKLFWTGDSLLGAAVSALGPIVFSSEMVVVHPPRQRTFLGREEWTQWLEGAFLLYQRFPEFFRRARARHFLLLVLGRWALLWPVRNAIKNSPWLLRNPRLYLKFIAGLASERLTLLRIVPRFWREHRSLVKDLKSERSQE
jgi:glycosyltransferase involved in cell wall biosynthesis